jgi:HEPN domain-containing protein
MEQPAAGRNPEVVTLWLRWADSDYRSARILILQGQLLQGAAFSDTAIEKYLKSLFAHLGLAVPKTHRVSELYAEIKQATSSDHHVNEGYLRLLEKAYKLRYPDEATEGFNIALNQARLLAQLDRTVKEIVDRFHIVERTTKRKIPSVLEQAILDQDEVILVNNVALNSTLAEGLFSSPSRSFDLRRHQGNLFDTNYMTASVTDGPDHEPEGFRVENGKLIVAYRPILESPNDASVNGIRQIRVDDNLKP